MKNTKIRRALAILLAASMVLEGANTLPVHAQEEPAIEDVEEIQSISGTENGAEVVADDATETLAVDVGEQACGEMLTEEMIKEYQADGTWDERVAFMKELTEINATSCEAETYSLNQSESTDSLAKVRNARATMDSVGDAKVLVFLVDFQDMKNTDENYTSEAVEEVLFGKGITNPAPALLDEFKMYYSLTEYYQISSKNKLNITGDVVGWYTAAGKRADYEDGAVGREKLIKELLEYYDETIDFSQYDGDGNGSIDNIYINFVGGDTGWGSQWWSYTTKWYYNEAMEVDGVCVDGYVWLHESLYTEDYQNTVYTMTAIHETGHCLGLPDYYDCEGSISIQGEGGGLGGYDMMDADVGDHNAFSKLMLGWIEEEDIQIADLSEVEQMYYLENFVDTNQILLVSADWKGDYGSEYFLLEYYTRTGLNANSMLTENGGIRVWHVNAAAAEGDTDFLYDNSYTDYKMLRLMEADGKEEISRSMTGSFSANEGDLYKTGDVFNANTVPNSDYYNKVYSGISIEFGACTDGKYEIKVHKENFNSEVPSVKSVTADSESENFWENTLYSGKAVTVTFSNNITVLDESKLVFETIEGTTCTRSDVVVGDNYITFQLNGGDETTQAYLEIQPGYYGNTSGVANEKTYRYNLKNISSDFKEKNMLGQYCYEELACLIGTVENLKGGKSAVVLHETKKEIYLVDSEDMSQVTLEMPIYDTNYLSYGVSQLNEGKFAVYYRGQIENELAMAVAVFEADGKCIGKYEGTSDNKADSICGGIMDFGNDTVGWMFQDYNGENDPKEYDEETHVMVEPVYLMTFHYTDETMEKKKVGYMYRCVCSYGQACDLSQFQKVGDNWISYTTYKSCMYVFDGDTLTKKYMLESDSNNLRTITACQMDNEGIHLIYEEGTPDSQYPWEYEVNEEHFVYVADISLDNYEVINKTLLMQYKYNENIFYNPSILSFHRTEYGYLAWIGIFDNWGSGCRQRALYVTMDAAYNILKVYPTTNEASQLYFGSNGTELWEITWLWEINESALSLYSVPEPEVLTYPVHISTNKEERLSLCGDYQLLAGGRLKLGTLLEYGERAIVKVNGKEIELEDNTLIIDEITEEIFIDIEIESTAYTVNFDVNGGVAIEEAMRKIEKEKKIGTLPETERKGYIFLGWYTAATGGTQVTEDTLVKKDMTVYAQWKVDEAYSEFEYSELADGTLEITGYSGSDTEIIIPAKINGKQVTSIGDYAFDCCSRLTSIVIPEGVTSIGRAAFVCCSGLTSIKISSGVTNIGDWAFSGCSGLTSINIPEGVTHIRSFTFFECSGLTSIELPKRVTSIEFNAFSGCSGLTSINIPEEVISIGQYAFSDCVGLTSIEIPSGVTHIAMYAFDNCKNLKSVTLPSSLEKIGERAFGYIWDDDYYDEGAGEYILLNDFSITGSIGSAAEKYAIENNIPYHSIIHTYTVILCAEHGTNLAGASPVTGIYRQV